MLVGEIGEKGKTSEKRGKGKIADFKIPKYVEFVDQYPLSPLGKVQKFKLRDELKQKYSL